MRKLVVRVCAAAFALATLLCSAQVVKGVQNIAPFDTDISFRINVASPLKQKDDIANEISSIGRELDTTIVKISPDKTDYKVKRDVIVFSGGTGSTVGPMVIEDEVHWFDRSLNGNIIAIDRIGDRSLNGEYMAREVPGLRQKIKDWAQSNLIEVEWSDLSSVASDGMILSNMMRSSTGLLLPSCFLLVLASTASFLQSIFYQQKIEIINGKPYTVIRIESVLGCLFSVMEGLFIGAFAGLLYLSVSTRSIERITVLLGLCGESIALISVILLLSVSVLALLSTPGFSELSKREHPKALKIFSGVLQFFGIVIASIAVSYTFSGINAKEAVLRQMDSFSKFPSAVRVSMLAVPDTEESPENELFIEVAARAEHSEDAILTLDVNQAIGITQHDLGDYDHFVLVNESFIKKLDIGVGHSGLGGSLVPIDNDEIPKIALDQLGVWTKDGSIAGEFYCYKGDGLLTFGPNVGNGGESVLCKNPIVLLVDDFEEKWSADNLIVPLMTTGNIFFSNYEKAIEHIEGAGAGEFVASVDNIFELSMKTAQDIDTQIRSLVIAACSSFALVIVMGFQEAGAWAIKRERTIFALRSNGESALSIVFDCFGSWLIRSFAAIALCFAYETTVLGYDATMPLLSGVAVMFCLISFQIVFRCYFAWRQFNRAVSRR